jgi:hypothetical protein
VARSRNFPSPRAGDRLSLCVAVERPLRMPGNRYYDVFDALLDYGTDRVTVSVRTFRTVSELVRILAP